MSDDDYTPDESGAPAALPPHLVALMGGNGTTETPNATPLPGGQAPARARAPRKTAGAKKVGKRTAKRATSAQRPDASAQDVASAIAEATSAATAREPRGPGRPSKHEIQEELSEDALRNLYIGLGASASTLGVMFHQDRVKVVGVAMMRQGPACAAALVQWANVNPMVAKALATFKTAGGFALVAAAHTPIVVAAITGVAPPPPEDGPDPAAGVDDLAAMFDMFGMGGGLAGFPGAVAGD